MHNIKEDMLYNITSTITMPNCSIFQQLQQCYAATKEGGVHNTSFTPEQYHIISTHNLSIATETFNTNRYSNQWRKHKFTHLSFCIKYISINFLYLYEPVCNRLIFQGINIGLRRKTGAKAEQLRGWMNVGNM